MHVKHYSFLLLITIMISAQALAQGQKQLVLMNREKVIIRFNPGDEFIISIKGGKKKWESYINNLFDTAVLVHKTLVPLHKIDKIYFKQSGLINLIGKFLVVGGVGYFVIDQFNTVIVQGDKASIDEGVATTSAVMVGVGLPMLLIKKKSQRIGGRYRLMTVEEGSPFYLAPSNP
jgi:hypothetical protein